MLLLLEDNRAHRCNDFIEKMNTTPTCEKSTPSWSALYCSLLRHASLANERLQILEGRVQRLLRTTGLEITACSAFPSSGVAPINHTYNHKKTRLRHAHACMKTVDLVRVFPGNKVQTFHIKSGSQEG